MDLMKRCVEIEPSSFEEAVKQLFWVNGMLVEYDSIVRNNVWDVVPTLENKLVVSSRWLYKVNKVVYGHVEKNKARFVAIGFSQVEEIDYDETFYPVARINSYFIVLGFTKIEVDTNLNHITISGKLLIIVLYVDDLSLTGDDKLMKSCKEDSEREFEMKVLGLMHYFMAMEVWQCDDEIIVSLGKCANLILKRFYMESSKPMETPLTGNWRKGDATSGEVVEAIIHKKLVGSLMYLVKAGMDMCYAINHLIQDMVNLNKLYLKATKHVLRCLKGTTQYGLW
eukprot:PITA_26997